MATARIARIVAAESVGPGTRLLDLVMVDGEPLGFRGGQYIIVNTGIELPGGKLAKRAYSILSGDADQERVRVAVKAVPHGPASGLLQTIPVGGELPFSGPWGKLGPQAADEDAGAGGDAVTGAASGGDGRRTLVVATDTGITAALGLLAGRAMASSLARTCVVWFVESSSYFLPHDFVAARVPTGCGGLHVEIVPPVGHPGRIFQARHAMAPWMSGRTGERFDAAYLAGDGAVLHALERGLVHAGTAPDAIRMEAFFNNPARKAPSATASTAG